MLEYRSPIQGPELLVWVGRSIEIFGCKLKPLARLENPISKECRFRFYLPPMQRQDMFYCRNCPMFWVVVF
jgi:hypothetical protein